MQNHHKGGTEQRSGQLLIEVQGSEQIWADDLSFLLYHSGWFSKEYLETSGKGSCLCVARPDMFVHNCWINDSFSFGSVLNLNEGSHFWNLN